MDDFLHNLRSGKLKQGDRPNRPYNDQQFKGGPRRNLDHRNKGGRYENKDSFNAIKEVLESLVDSQKQMTEAYQARTRAEERKARAMEVIAKNLYRMLNPNATDVDEVFSFQEPEALVQPVATRRDRTTLPNTSELQSNASADASDEIETAEALSEKQETDSIEVEAQDTNIQDMDTSETEEETVEEELKTAGEEQSGSPGRLPEEERRMLFKVIDRMRTEGHGWEKIARDLTAQGYPTISGKGTWRGIMVKNLHEKMATS